MACSFLFTSIEKLSFRAFSKRKTQIKYDFLFLSTSIDFIWKILKRNETEASLTFIHFIMLFLRIDLLWFIFKGILHFCFYHLLIPISFIFFFDFSLETSMIQIFRFSFFRNNDLLFLNNTTLRFFLLWACLHRFFSLFFLTHIEWRRKTKQNDQLKKLILQERNEENTSRSIKQTKYALIQRRKTRKYKDKRQRRTSCAPTRKIFEITIWLILTLLCLFYRREETEKKNNVD